MFILCLYWFTKTYSREQQL